MKVTTDGERFVLGARLEDDHVWTSLTDRDADLWTQEVFEWFLDPDGDGSDYLEFQINPLGTVFDARFEEKLGTGRGSRSEQIDRARAFDLEGLERAVHVEGTVADERSAESDAEYWSVELAVPFESLPGVDDKPLVADWAVNFYRFERPPGGGARAFAWDPRPSGDFHQVSKFGKLRFDISPGALDMLPGGTGNDESGSAGEPPPGESSGSSSNAPEEKSQLDPSVVEPLQLDKTLPEAVRREE